MDGFLKMPARRDPYLAEDREKIQAKRRAGGRA
jgi:hypothetical protein